MTVGERVLLTLVPFVYLVLLGTGVCVWLAVGPLHALSRVALFVCMAPAFLALIAAGSGFGGARRVLSGRVAAVTLCAPLMLVAWACTREPAEGASVGSFVALFLALHGLVCAGLWRWARAGER